MNNVRKMLYIFPRVVDTVIQNTTENEIARSLRGLGYTVDTVVAYQREMTELDGFDHVEYVKKSRSGVLASLRYHWTMLKRMVSSDAGVILVNFPAMHLVPLAKLMQLGKVQKPLWIMDIRSVPVDVAPNWRGRMRLFRYRLGIVLAELMCDGMTVITPALGDTVTPRLRRLKDRVGIWSSGVTLEHFASVEGDMRKELDLEGKKVLMYHGVISPNRGLRDLVEAVALVVLDYPDLRLLLVGDGPGLAELRELTREPPLKGVVTIVGAVPYAQIGRYIATADAGVLPFPNIEWWAVSSPIKLMEYLAMGLPVIATDITAIRYVTDRTGGAVLAKDNRPESLATAIRNYLDNGCVPAKREILEDVISWNAQAKSLGGYIQRLSESASP